MIKSKLDLLNLEVGTGSVKTSMNGKILLDTNILVYIYDPLDTAKQECAIAVTDQLIRSRKAVISTQVLGEFFMATTRTRRLLLTPSEALVQMRNW